VDNTLQHVGVMGMHWGQRKSEPSTGARNRRASQDHAHVSNIKKKKVHEMSNEELKAVAARIQLEQQYSTLNQKKVSKGRKMVEEVLNNQGKQALGALLIGAAGLAVKLGKDYVTSEMGKRQAASAGAMIGKAIGARLGGL
jgi:hypothetical protein